KMEQDIIRNNGKIHNLEAQQARLTSITVETLALSILFNSMPPFPKFNDDIGIADADTLKQEKGGADRYFSSVRRALENTQWGMSLRAIDHEAEIEGERIVREIPPNERPANVDPLELRHYFIARVKCERAAIFIAHERLDALTKYQTYLSLLR